MFLFQRPSPHAIEQFLRESQDLSLSYKPVGLAQGLARGFDFDETEVVIGKGVTDHERARVALTSWTQFDLGWVELFPRNAPVEPGSVVAVLIRHFGFWSLNGCRVVYADDREPGSRFGFAYGTLTNHAEAGEELFEVSLHPDSGDVTYRIRAASRPRALLARMGYPIARLLQARFRRDSAEAMKHAIA